MVRTINDSKQKDRFTERLFLGSLNKWCPNGVECVVSNVSKIFEDKKHTQKIKIKTEKGTEDITLPKTKIAIQISVLDTMPHIKANKLDENGEYIMIEDPFNETKTAETETLDNQDDVDVTFFHNLAISGSGYDETKDLQEQEFIINNKSKLWPLLNFGFIKHGDIPKGNTKTLGCYYDEIIEVLTSLKFIGKRGKNQIPGGKPYQVLLPEDSIAYADEYDTPVVAEPVLPKEPKKEEDISESPAKDMDVEDFDDLDKIPQVHVDYLGKKNPYIKEAVQTLTAGNVPLTSQKLMQELSFMVTDKTMTINEYNDAKDLVFQTLA